MIDNSLPECIGYYGKPVPPNGPCEKCKSQELCRKVIAKERLQPILAKIEEAQIVLRCGKTKLIGGGS